MATSKFKQECLDAHNDKRSKHGMSKLKLSSELCKGAQKWAEELIKTGTLTHSQSKHNGAPLGENIAGKTSTGTVTEYTGQEVTDQWYSEIKDYDFKKHDTGTKTGHFSQVVWKDSKELGVGMATKDGKCIVVANYFPAGNYVGMYKDNVAPLKSGSAKSKSKSKKRSDSSSSSSSSDEDNASSHRGCVANAPTTSGSGYGTSKVTITKTITKPDGTVETIVEERVEKVKNPSSFKESDPTPASGPIVSKSKQSKSEFQKDALETHNKFRSKHKVPKLKLNSDLSTVAQKWADHLASIASLEHSNNTFKSEPLGENIASKWGSAGADYTGEEVTKQWYSEESAYDYSGKSNAGNSGHFSQVVWKGSEELGIGKAADTRGRVYVVANYRPAGNYIGNFAANVLKP